MAEKASGRFTLRRVRYDTLVLCNRSDENWLKGALQPKCYVRRHPATQGRNWVVLVANSCEPPGLAAVLAVIYSDMPSPEPLRYLEISAAGEPSHPRFTPPYGADIQLHFSRQMESDHAPSIAIVLIFSQPRSTPTRWPFATRASQARCW